MSCRTLVIAIALASCTTAPAATLLVDLGGLAAVGRPGHASNTRKTIPLPTGATLTSVRIDIGGYFPEFIAGVLGPSRAVDLTIHVRSSDGLVDFVHQPYSGIGAGGGIAGPADRPGHYFNVLGLPWTAGTDAELTIEIAEAIDDLPFGPDARLGTGSAVWLTVDGVPEPSTASSLATAAALMLRHRRRPAVPASAAPGAPCHTRRRTGSQRNHRSAFFISTNSQARA